MRVTYDDPTEWFSSRVDGDEDNPVIVVENREGAALYLDKSFIDEYIDEDVYDIVNQLAEEAIEVYYLEYDHLFGVPSYFEER
ncbi:hypothetical protein [Halorubellus litoreus]|uniref:Uncharacterized protein n=1 Tax=Halorubellus litoreus TaxID=755308 RepID=A0ABD5VJ64_9EURY